MAKFVSVKPQCSDCHGELAIEEIMIDMVNCNYVLRCECIMCQNEQFYILSLADFIELSQIMGGKDAKLPDMPSDIS